MEVMEFQLNYFKSYNMMLLKCCTQYVSKFGKLSSGHKTGKGQFSSQSQRRAMPKNVQTILQLCSFHMLVKLCSKSFKLGFNSTWTRTSRCSRQLPDGFRKVRTTRDQIVNIHWVLEKAREFQKNMHFFFIDYTKDLGCVDHNKLWNILKETGIPDHFTCPLRSLYVGHKATVRTRRGTMDWFKIGKGLWQGYILSPCLFNLYTEYIKQNAGLDESQAGIKISRRNIYKLTYADDTTLMAENEEKLKSLLMRVKEKTEKAGWKLNIQKPRPSTIAP